MKKLLLILSLALSINAFSQSTFLRDAITSGTNTYTTSITGYNAYAIGDISVRFTNAPSGASTLNINSLGAVAMRVYDGSNWVALSGGELDNVTFYRLSYYPGGPYFQVHRSGSGSGGGTWGTITGTLSDQTDLQTAFDGKVNDTGNETIAGTKTFSSTIVGSINGNAATVTTNANLTGDVTSSGNATTISNNVVTFGKMQAITDQRLLGSQGGTAVEELSVSSPLTLSSNAVGIQTANGSQAGAISSADWLAHSRKANQRFNYINAQTGTSYTALAADSITRTLVTMDNASANNFIIPTNTTLPYRTGTELYVSQIGDGTTSIIGADGTVTLTYQAGVSSAVSKNGINVARKTGTNTWTVYNGTPPQVTGDLTKTNGTYVTITLSGDPTDALHKDVNITADLTSAVPVSLGGTGLTSLNAGDIIWGSAANTYAAKNILATTQTAYWHLKAGTATASTAPIKLTTGTVNTTAEAGALEYTTPQLFFTNGGARRQEIPQIQQSRVSTQFDATSNTTLANVTGLTATVVASRTYRFEAELYTTSNVAGGVKFAIGGTATATNIIYECTVIDANVNAAQTRATALATEVGGVTAVTVAYAKIRGTITVNAAGTITVQFAQNASNGSASSVLVGSMFVLTEML